MAIEPILQALAGLPSPLVVFTIAMLPVVELRGSLPLALAVYHLPLWQAYLTAVAGSLLPGVVILLAWTYVIRFLERVWPWLHRVMERHQQHLERRWRPTINRYGLLGLVLFVAIPLPLFGVWSGALIAWVLDMRLRDAVLAMLIGNMIAGAIVAGLTLSGLRIL